MAQMQSCPMEQERYELTFPPNHGLNKLRVLWAGDCCAQLPLRLNLASGIPQGVSLPGEGSEGGNEAPDLFDRLCRSGTLERDFFPVPAKENGAAGGRILYFCFQ